MGDPLELLQLPDRWTSETMRQQYLALEGLLGEIQSRFLHEAQPIIDAMAQIRGQYTIPGLVVQMPQTVKTGSPTCET